MLRKTSISLVRLIYFKIIRLFTISIFILFFAYALTEIADRPLISDKLLESIYYGNRKVNKISYEELSKSNHSDVDIEFKIIENYYSNYINLIGNKEIDNSKREKLQSIPTKSIQTDSNNKNSRTQLENIDFIKSIHSIYSNTTIFNIDLKDLERIVETKILSDGQALLLWESLLHSKTDRVNSVMGRQNNEQDNEVYLFNFIAIKTLGISFLSMMIILVSHKLLLTLIKQNFISNMIYIFLTYYFIDTLYSWKYYMASSIMIAQFGLCLKYLLDYIMSNLGYTKEIYDILLNTTKTNSIVQFTIKTGITLVLTSVMAYIAFIKFNYFFNYIIFYFCLIQLMYLISSFWQYEAPLIFQPFKHFLLVSLGILNFLFSNFHRKISRNNKINTKMNENDSFYIVSEFFSFICISYLYEFLIIQANNVAHLVCEKSNDNDDNNNDKISSSLQDFKEHQKNFGYEDSLWVLVFLFWIFFSLVGVYNSRYLTFLFSLQYIKVILKVFGSLYKVKILRIVYSHIILFLILTNYVTTEKIDHVLFDICLITSLSTMAFVKFIVRIVGILFIILIIKENLEFIVDKQETIIDPNQNEEEIAEQLLKKVGISAVYEKKKKKKIKKLELQIIRENLTPFNIFNIIYMHFDLNTNYFSICLIFYLIKDIEKNYLVIVLYGILVLILIIRIYFIINEFKNITEFSYAFLITFLMGIRLLTISKNNLLLYFVGCIYLFTLIVFYCTSERKQFIVTILVFLNLFSACIHLNSNYFIILMVTLICVPITLMFDENKYACSLLKFFFPGLVIMALQLYGFKNIISGMVMLSNHLLLMDKEFNLINLVKGVVQGNYFNEYSIIEWILEKISQILN